MFHGFIASCLAASKVFENIVYGVIAYGKSMIQFSGSFDVAHAASCRFGWRPESPQPGVYVESLAVYSPMGSRKFSILFYVLVRFAVDVSTLAPDVCPIAFVSWYRGENIVFRWR
jgi:hypothetical protein